MFPIFGLLVSYLWLTYGLLVTYLWVTCGLLMGYLWLTFGLLGTYLGLLGTYLWSTSVLLGTHLWFPWNLPVKQLCLTIGPHLRLTWDSLLTLLGFFWNFPGTHLWVTCGLLVCFHEAYLCFLWLTCDLEKQINPSNSYSKFSLCNQQAICIELSSLQSVPSKSLLGHHNLPRKKNMFLQGSRCGSNLILCFPTAT